MEGGYSPPGKPDVQIVDLGDMDDRTFSARIKEIANAPMSLIGQVLAEIIVVKCGQRGDVLVSRIHHAIADGFGMVVLTEDLIKLLVGLPIQSPAVSHQEYISRFEQPPAARVAEFEAFWKQMHKDFPVAPNMGRKAKGLEPLVTSIGRVDPRLLKVSLDENSSGFLKSRADRLGVSPFCLMYTGFLESQCECYNLQQLMFVSHFARSERTLDTYIGDHTLDPVTRFVALGPARLEQSALAQNENMIRVWSYLPHDAARRGTTWDKEIMANGGYPRQISVNQRLAQSRQNRSILRGKLDAEPGKEQKMGPS